MLEDDFAKSKTQLIKELQALRQENTQLRGQQVHHQETEKALLQSEARFRLAVDSIPEVVVIYDAERRFQFINATGLQRGGDFLENYLHYRDDDLFPEEITRGYVPLLEQVRSTRKPQYGEFTITLPTVGLHHFTVHYVPILDQKGEIEQILAITYNITERKAFEQALQRLNQELEQRVEERSQKLSQSEEKFRGFFDHAPIGIAVSSFDTSRFAAVNPAMCRMLEYTEAEMMLLSCHAITHEEDLVREDPLLEAMVRGEIDAYQMEKRYFKKNGDLLWVDLTLRIVRDEAGTPIYAIGMVQDITHRKQIEEERRQAEIKLQASLEEKSVLLQEIHHRVKNNLQTVSSLLRLQAANIQDPHILEPFKESQNRVRAMALIHETLYQSQTLSKINLSDYVQKLTQELFTSYGVATNKIKLQIEIEKVDLVIDTVIPCGLIINELISNAIKYAFVDRPSGTLFVQFARNEQGSFTLSIRDDGVGLPESIDYQKTTSLGLRLVCSLVRQLQGSISLDRSHGTSFSITFATAAT